MYDECFPPYLFFMFCLCKLLVNFHGKQWSTTRGSQAQSFNATTKNNGRLGLTQCIERSFSGVDMLTD